MIIFPVLVLPGTWLDSKEYSLSRNLLFLFISFFCPLFFFILYVNLFFVHFSFFLSFFLSLFLPYFHSLFFLISWKVLSSEIWRCVFNWKLKGVSGEHGASTFMVDRRRYFPPRHPFTFNGLHGGMFQKIELFVATVMRTTNPAFFIFVLSLNHRFFLYFCP